APSPSPTPVRAGTLVRTDPDALPATLAEAETRARDANPAQAGADYTRAATSPPASAAPPAPAPAPTLARAEQIARGSNPAQAGADYTRKAPTTPAPSTTSATPPSSKPAPRPSATRSAPAPTAGGPWQLQLGAFGIAANAQGLWQKVHARPEIAGHGRKLEPAGRLTKLLVTGYASKQDAETACSRLRAGGFDCLAVHD
ncbi:SPOR domain-containing protein, partial [Novosphingobium sp. 1949]